MSKQAVITVLGYHVRTHQSLGSDLFMPMCNDFREDVQKILHDEGFSSKPTMQAKIKGLPTKYPTLFSFLPEKDNYDI